MFFSCVTYVSPFLVLKTFCFVQAVRNWYKLSPWSHSDLAWNKLPKGLQNLNRFRSSSRFGAGFPGTGWAHIPAVSPFSAQTPKPKGTSLLPALVSFPESCYTGPNLETLWLHSQNPGEEGARQVIALFQMPPVSKRQSMLCRYVGSPAKHLWKFSPLFLLHKRSSHAFHYILTSSFITANPVWTYSCKKKNESKSNCNCL